MSGRVFVHSLRLVSRTAAVLSIASGLFYYLVLFAFTSFIGGAENVPFFARPPKAMEAFLGGSADFFRPSGWLAVAMNHPITLALLTASAMVVAAGSVATEIERGTIDLVIARPVRRVPFLAGKAAAAIVTVTAAEVGGFAGVLVARLTVDRIGEIPLSEAAKAFAGSWVLFVALAMVGILASAHSSLRGRALGLSVGVVVAWYFMNFIALLIDGVSGMRYASPFHYFRAGEVLQGEALPDLLVLVALGGAAIAAGLWWFARRDLTH